MTLFLYGLIVFVATTVGAISGLGGGVIIKPLLDVFALHTAGQIGFYSSCCVFSMCLMSIWRQRKQGDKISVPIAGFLSAGSLLGGALGDTLFTRVQRLFENPETIRELQSGILFLCIVAILAYTAKKERIRRFQVKNKMAMLLAGAALGVISTFLGIGGGPLNIALLSILFSFEMKECVRYSIVIIFFSQLSKLAAVGFSGAALGYDFTPLLCMIPAALLGGLLGSRLGTGLSNKGVEHIYLGTMCFLLLICARNFFA